MLNLSGIYSDSRGNESIVIQNDGKTLRTRIRGVDFEGNDFDSLGALSEASDFVLQHGDLCDCTIAVDFPARLIAPEGVRTGLIHAEIILGAPDDRGGIKSELIQLTMNEPEFSASTTGKSGWFEDELLSIAAQLPKGFALQACITCGLSDYSPYGHGSFGCLACFKNAKEDYRLVSSKAGIFAIWNRMTEYVQETHYCSEYENRPKGRGYRG
jgi:hypothetical protein